jgi:hypothetical protein
LPLLVWGDRIAVAIKSVTLSRSIHGSSSSFDWPREKRDKTSGRRALWLFVALNGACIMSCIGGEKMSAGWKDSRLASDPLNWVIAASHPRHEHCTYYYPRPQPTWFCFLEDGHSSGLAHYTQEKQGRSRGAYTCLMLPVVPGPVSDCRRQTGTGGSVPKRRPPYMHLSTLSKAKVDEEVQERIAFAIQAEEWCHS